MRCRPLRVDNMIELTWEDMAIMHRWSLKRCRAMARADERDYKISARFVKRQKKE